MTVRKGQAGGVNWGHPGRRFQQKDPLADMGVGNKRPLLIALGIGAAVACGLYLSWEKREAARDEAAAAADTAFTEPTGAGYGAKPSPAEMRAGIEKLLKGDRPDTTLRVKRREDALPSKDPVLGI